MQNNQQSHQVVWVIPPNVYDFAEAIVMGVH